MSGSSPAARPSPLLSTSNLSAFYGPVQALFDVTMDLPAGSVTALLGSNGAGKTTLLRALCAMVRTEGCVQFDGRRIDGWRTDAIARLGIAHVPEGRGTFAGLTVDENLRAAAIARPDGAASRLARVYQRFPRLDERRRQPAGELSGGEQQMLAIGRALMLAPRLLLLDEPSFGLAPRLVSQVFDVLRTITHEQGVTTLIVEQNAELALALADRAFVLEAGHLVFRGAPDEVRQDAALRRAYLGV